VSAVEQDGCIEGRGVPEVLTPRVQGQASDEGLLSPRIAGDAKVDIIPPIVSVTMASAGQPLDARTQTLMEARFAHDFSQVRVHTDGKAVESARAMNATAYTVNRDIAFDTGKYAPEHDGGKKLLAQELAHVVQQSRGGAPAQSTALERGADRAASEFSQSTGPIQVSESTVPRLSRQKAPDAQTPKFSIEKVAKGGRTIIALDGVAIAETTAPPEQVDVQPQWTPRLMEVTIVSPEEVFFIEGSKTEAALGRLSDKYRLRKQGPKRQELSIETSETLSGPRENRAPTKRAPKVVPSRTPPAPLREEAPAAPAASPPPASPLQIVKPPVTNLDLPQSAKIGKPQTQKEAAQEGINTIIRDAIAGRSGIPPALQGMDQRSLVDAITQVVREAAMPFIRGLSKPARDLVLDKLGSAVEAGLVGVAEAALDAARLDGGSKAAILKTLEGGLKLKPSQPGAGQKP
jgi:hypothetical protein